MSCWKNSVTRRGSTIPTRAGGLLLRLSFPPQLVGPSDLLGMPKLHLLEMGDVAIQIVIEMCRGEAAHFAEFFESFVFHSGPIPKSSSGVSKSGTVQPRLRFRRSMWPFLLGLARCVQFHVTSESQPRQVATAK